MRAQPLGWEWWQGKGWEGMRREDPSLASDEATRSVAGNWRAGEGALCANTSPGSSQTTHSAPQADDWHWQLKLRPRPAGRRRLIERSFSLGAQIRVNGTPDDDDDDDDAPVEVYNLRAAYFVSYIVYCTVYCTRAYVFLGGCSVSSECACGPARTARWPEHFFLSFFPFLTESIRLQKKNMIQKGHCKELCYKGIRGKTKQKLWKVSILNFDLITKLPL